MLVGTRRSPLAMWQARHLKDRLARVSVGAELIPIVTRGDRIQDRALTKIGGKGLFLKEIEEALLDGRVDIAVHSLKDVPAEMPEGLVLAGFLGREDPRDALAGDPGTTLEELPRGAAVGTGSLRRAVQILKVRPDLRICPIRGHV